jgi:excisionase family DNA binding protein
MAHMRAPERASLCLTVSEAALQLHCSAPTIRRRIASGELPAVKLGFRPRTRWARSPGVAAEPRLPSHPAGRSSRPTRLWPGVVADLESGSTSALSSGEQGSTRSSAVPIRLRTTLAEEWRAAQAALPGRGHGLQFQRGPKEE